MAFECVCTNPMHGGKIWKCHTSECKPCIKEGMTKETCRYNNILGCDCGYHKPNPDVARSSTHQK